MAVPAPLAKLGQTIGGFSIGQRTVAIIGIAVLVLGGIALATFVTQPRYSPLFTGLQAADASAIVEQLKTDGIPYELSNGGATIMVPEENVYDARLKAAAAGMPTAGQGGYSLLDDMGVTSSEFQQSVTYKRALEGELAKTVEALDGVKMASVKLAIPEETVFVDSKVDPTASIFVETTPGTTLTRDQVQSVVHLASAAVDGLKPENVAVVDAAGTLLSAVGVGATGGVDAQASDYEERIQAAVQGMLDRVVGRGNATVAVAADMSMESAERTEESFTDPKGAPALTESTKTENYEGTGGGSAGVLGPDNIAVPENSTGDGTFTSETSDRTNAVNKVTENRSIPAGSLERQTISVALDAASTQGLDVDKVTEMVSAAAGINTDRGDLVSVNVIPFNAEDATAAQDALAAANADAEAARKAELMRTLVIAGASVLALLLILAVILFRRRNKQNREPLDIGEFHEYEALPDKFQSLDAPATTSIPSIPVPAAVAAPVPVPAFGADEDSARKRSDLDAMAASDPAMMADYLRTVMDDRANA
ncbi:flagellar basal-body MS-ring/collar protein FliF [Arthrobacter sp. JSM 101049]|uniref:flagellar basal-body MS-ring/collar protein FliF n=1 Tax=Arthrobacter sp. JSM 101049 TaxID=929097 RepID=UPI003565DD5C